MTFSESYEDLQTRRAEEMEDMGVDNVEDLLLEKFCQEVDYQYSLANDK